MIMAISREMWMGNIVHVYAEQKIAEKECTEALLRKPKNADSVIYFGVIDLRQYKLKITLRN